MKYKISDISKISRISASGLRFYEKIGIISPSRSRNQKHRDFTQRELDIIFEYKTYRALGFSRQDSVDLLINDNPEKLQQKYDLCQKNILNEIEEKKILAEFVGRQSEQIKLSLKEKQACRVEMSPAIQRIKIWKPGDHEGEYVPFSYLQEWYDQIPFVDACFLFQMEDILNEMDVLHPNLGAGIETEFADALKFTPGAAGDTIPSRLCIHSFIEISEDLTIRGKDLDHVHEFIKENRLEITGDAVSRHIYNVFYKTANIRLDHLWIPIRSAE
jgi:DNA-binding transcriptional MerR regulator